MILPIVAYGHPILRKVAKEIDESYPNLPKLLEDPLYYGSGPVNIAVLVLAAAATYWGIRHLDKPFWLYQVTLLVFLLSTATTGEPLCSFSRYALLMFPMFIVLAFWTTGKRTRMAAFTASFMLLLLISGYFFMWMWVG